MSHYKPHPLASAMPDMTPAEYAVLLDDIRRSGLREPIVLFEGAILDGRNRYNACGDAGISPTVSNFAGTMEEAEAFVYSLNIARRHMTTAQRKAFIKRTIEVNPTEKDNEIAARTGVPKTTVQRMREDLELKTANEAKTELVRKAIEADPDARNTVIAKKVGVGKDTVRRIRTGAKNPSGSKAQAKPKKPKETVAARKKREALEFDLENTRRGGNSLLTARCAGLIALLNVDPIYPPNEVLALQELKDRLVALVDAGVLK